MTPAEYASKQNFPLSKAKIARYTELQLEQFRVAGIELVEILSGRLQDDCAGIRQLEGKNFTIDTVPKLPLAECNSKSCQCRYIAKQKPRSVEEIQTTDEALRKRDISFKVDWKT